MSSSATARSLSVDSSRPPDRTLGMTAEHVIPKKHPRSIRLPCCSTRLRDLRTWVALAVRARSQRSHVVIRDSAIIGRRFLAPARPHARNDGAPAHPKGTRGRVRSSGVHFSERMCVAKTSLKSAPGLRSRSRTRTASPGMPRRWRMRPATRAERLKPMPQ